MSLINADEVKPDFDNLKDYWKNMLDNFFDNGKLKASASIKVTCPHCGKKTISSEFTLNGFRHVSCDCCGTLYVSPRLKDSCIEELYSNDYYSEKYAKNMIPVFNIRKEKIGRSKYKQINDFSPTKGAILDIGAGVGEVLDVFKDNHWKTHATEMNPVAYKWLLSRGYDSVFHGTLDEFKTQQQYDVIMAWGVIEHVLNPTKFLEKVFTMLKPNGIFISEVPFADSFLVEYCRKNNTDPGRIIMGEQHIVFYSIKSYRELHEKARLKEKKIQTNGLDIETIFKVTGNLISDDLLFSLQKIVDDKMMGDLLRGFWQKK